MVSFVFCRFSIFIQLFIFFWFPSFFFFFFAGRRVNFWFSYPLYAEQPYHSYILWNDIFIIRRKTNRNKTTKLWIWANIQVLDYRWEGYYEIQQEEGSVFSISYTSKHTHAYIHSHITCWKHLYDICLHLYKYVLCADMYL